jgi:hypothetical protein
MPGRRRAPGEAEAGVGAAGSVGGGVRLRFEPIDELLEDGLELGIVGVGVAADDVDGFAVPQAHHPAVAALSGPPRLPRHRGDVDLGADARHHAVAPRASVGCAGDRSRAG